MTSSGLEHGLGATAVPWWKQKQLRKLVFLQGMILCSQMIVGYQEVVAGSFQAMKPWVKAMGNPDASMVGLITAIMFVGGTVGAIVAEYPADKYGRRFALALGCGFGIVGSALQSGANGRGVFIAGRCIVGIGISFTTNAGPCLLNEISHPAMRGSIAALFNSLWYVGSIIAAWTCFGTGYLESNWSWRIPSILQAIFPMIVLVSLWFMPESPRWLCAKDRHEEARAFIVRYHAENDASATVVAVEMAEITTALQLERDGNMAAWSTMVKSKPTLKRMGLVVAVALLLLWSGQGVISYYFSPLLTSVGITNTNVQTGINGGMSVWNLVCSVIGAILAEKIGRRKLWLVSFIGMILANVPMIISGKLFDLHGKESAATSVIVFMFLYNAGFNIGCNPLPYAYCVELLPYSIRTRGMSLFVLTGQIMLTVTQYANPVAVESIGWYYYVFFLGVLLFGTVLIYFTFPETKGKTLEELGGLFGDNGAAIDRIAVIDSVRVDEAKTSKWADGLGVEDSKSSEKTPVITTAVSL